MSTTNPFDGFIPQERQPRNLNQLTAGVYQVVIERVVVTDDNSLINGEPINNVQNKKDWVDVNPVLYLYLVAPEGVFHYRFYWYGYKKWCDILKDPKYNKEIEKYRPPYQNACRQYAIVRDTNTRIEDEQASAHCRKLMEEFATAAGCAATKDNPGKPINEWQGHSLYIELVDQYRDGGQYMKLLQVSDKPIQARQRSGNAAQPIRVNPDQLDKTWTM